MLAWRRFACLILLVGLMLGAGYPLPEGVRRNIHISKGEFLVASSLMMRDPRFASSVVLLLSAGEKEGTIGVILNHATKISVHQLLPDLTAADQLANPVYIGGPVSPRQAILLARTNRSLAGFTRIEDHISYSGDGGAIKKWFSGGDTDEESPGDKEDQGGKQDQPKESIRFFAGYSGWAPGQLEGEMEMGAWNILPADDKTVFDFDPNDLWDELNRRTTLQQAQFIPPQKH